MNGVSICLCILLTFAHWSACLVPAKFQWKTIDFKWEGDTRARAIEQGSYVPENIMPTGLAVWHDKLFITIPRWKKGVPASLNYVMLNGTQNQPLQPYPTWHDAYVSDLSCCASTNCTVISAFRVSVDSCDRLWTVDNGVTDMAGEVKQISDPAIFIFNLKNDTLIQKHVLADDVLKDSSVLTSIVVDDGDGCDKTFAYITDMGSNALIVFDMAQNQTWRVEHPYFHFDPGAGVYRVGGVDFYWTDGVSSATLSKKNKGARDLYLHPTSSTKLFKISTSVLKNPNATKEEIQNSVEVVGDRGPNSQATACDLDPKTNILFFTQLSKNGVGCWNLKYPLDEDNAPLVISDCNLLEFPNDIKVDEGSNIWVLSNRQSRFLYGSLDHDQVNFRILTAPVKSVIKGTTCEKSKSRKRKSSASSSQSLATAPSNKPAKAKSKGSFFSRKKSK